MRKILYGVLGTLALGLASCSSDEPVGQVSQKVESDQTQYLAVSISTPTNNLSRADGDALFSNGVTNESEIKQLIFVFYDGSGAPTGKMVSLSSDDAADGLTTGWTTNVDGNNVTKFWTSVIPVEMTQGQDKPVYVMCYVNPVDNSKLESMTLSEIDAAVRTSIQGANGLFAMSNSVYYGNNPITGQSGVRMMATPIIEGQLFSSEDDAKKVLAADASETDQKLAIDIYVERYAAKIGLSMAPTVVGTYPVLVAGENGTLTDGTITFTPTYWHPNAIDKTTYITKGFNTTVNGASATQPATLTDLNTAFAATGMAGKWNDPDNFRSYWACSPSYYKNTYPQCSDNITDVTSTNAPDPYNLKYYSYTEITNNPNGIAWNATSGFAPANSADGKSASGYYYVRETTASIEAITAENTNNKAVVASAIIVGNYRLNNTETATPTFYLYGRSNGKDIYYTDANIKKAIIANQNVIFDDNGLTRTTNEALYSVVHPSAAVRGDDNVPGRLVTIQLTTAPTPAVYFYDQDANDGEGGYVPVTETNLNKANRLLWASASTAQKFHQGLAYFSIPIRHLGWGLNVDDNKLLLVDGTATTGGRATMINWQNLRRGDLGVVRNHVYNIVVTGITGLGVGLGGVDQPLVPPMDPDNYYVAARLNVLSWRVVPTQTVTL